MSEPAPERSSMVCTPWATVDDLPASVVTTPEGVAAAEWTQTLTDALLAASDVLYAFSGRRWRGTGCERTVHLAVDAPGGCDPVAVRRARILTGRLGRMTLAQLRLPDWPVTAITEVRDPDGAVIPTDGYRLVRGRYLQRLDDAGRVRSWPLGEHQVTYTFGQAPPYGGVRAAAALATELALAVRGEKCRLPQRVQSITRQGISIAVLDPFEFLDKGRTGLADVDTWLTAVNPRGLARRPSVWSPDTDTTRVTR